VQEPRVGFLDMLSSSLAAAEGKTALRSATKVRWDE
jgi:hypothetical protein